MLTGNNVWSFICGVAVVIIIIIQNVFILIHIKDVIFEELCAYTKYLYRSCRPDEDICIGIFCKDSTSTRTVSQHVHSGSRYDSKYISTTADPNVVIRWYEEGCRIVRISLEAIRGTDIQQRCINLLNDAVRSKHLPGNMQACRAKSSKEVIFENTIPKYIFNPYYGWDMCVYTEQRLEDLEKLRQMGKYQDSENHLLCTQPVPKIDRYEILSRIFQAPPI